MPSPHLERAPGAFVRGASPVSRTLLVFCVNKGVSASFSLSLSYGRFWTARSWSIKGPQQPAQNNMQLCIFQRIKKFLFCDLSYQLRPKLEFQYVTCTNEDQTEPAIEEDYRTEYMKVLQHGHERHFFEKWWWW